MCRRRIAPTPPPDPKHTPAPHNPAPPGAFTLPTHHPILGQTCRGDPVLCCSRASERRGCCARTVNHLCLNSSCYSYRHFCTVSHMSEKPRTKKNIARVAASTLVMSAGLGLAGLGAAAVAEAQPAPLPDYHWCPVNSGIRAGVTTGAAIAATTSTGTTVKPATRATGTATATADRPSPGNKPYDYPWPKPCRSK